jgi:hypothetical protein
VEKKMLFINPMWDNEAQRIGKRKCTPLGYNLHFIADLLGFIGLLLLIGTTLYRGYSGVAGSFHAALLWLLAVPFGLGVIGQILYRYSWKLAYRRGFRYDYETREASWMEDGKCRTYKWEPNHRDRAR